MNPLIPLVLIWSIVLAAGAFISGQHVQSNADKAAQLEAAENEAEKARQMNHASLESGVRTEQAQAKTDATFSAIRSEYETEQKTHPDIGCVLDPISLRLWNAANTQSDPAAAGEPADQVPDPADPGVGIERGEQPFGSGAPVPPVQQ
jgi:hypothetical protein